MPLMYSRIMLLVRGKLPARGTLHRGNETAWEMYSEGNVVINMVAAGNSTVVPSMNFRVMV